jgi:hypothetical protein
MPRKSNIQKGNCKSYTEQHRATHRQLEKAEANNCYDFILAEKLKEIEARAVYDALHVGAPDFIINALVLAIDAAARSQNMTSPTYADDETETREQAIEKIADILLLAHDYKPADPESPAALAAHIAAILNHPPTPVDLHNAMSDELADLDGYDDHNSPEHFERALVAFHSQQEGATQ